MLLLLSLPLLYAVSSGPVLLLGTHLSIDQSKKLSGFYSPLVHAAIKTGCIRPLIGYFSLWCGKRYMLYLDSSGWGRVAVIPYSIDERK